MPLKTRLLRALCVSFVCVFLAIQSYYRLFRVCYIIGRVGSCVSLYKGFEICLLGLRAVA